MFKIDNQASLKFSQQAEKPKIALLSSIEKPSFVDENEHTNMSDYAIANLRGQFGQFVGPLTREQKSFEGIVSYYQDSYSLEASSICPARKGFCRPYLNDDGYHLLPLCLFKPEDKDSNSDLHLCVEVMKSWIYTINKEGFISST